jgi:hypothetical protein
LQCERDNDVIIQLGLNFDFVLDLSFDVNGLAGLKGSNLVSEDDSAVIEDESGRVTMDLSRPDIPKVCTYPLRTIPGCTVYGFRFRFQGSDSYAHVWVVETAIDLSKFQIAKGDTTSPDSALISGCACLGLLTSQ